uniref:Uncharacterized protein n=1 Tax=Picea glauca TaxID=3330 RepID=A0A124GNR0_PICGL|nr:hypothetical protein ABT39_MTgene2822 [Picea glauca]QHR87643.1 hypothetical protein Q903MT_gene1655 [Picea sitchensis]
MKLGVGVSVMPFAFLTMPLLCMCFPLSSMGPIDPCHSSVSMAIHSYQGEYIYNTLWHVYCDAGIS